MDIQKIDIHVHSSMWEGAKIQPGVVLASPEQLQESYRELGVEKAFLLPLISPEYRFCVQTNEEMEYLANKYSDTFYWFCNIDPRMGRNSTRTDFSEFLLQYKERGALGVGEVTANMPMDDPRMEHLFAACAEFDMPVTIHIAHQIGDTYGIYDDLGLPKLEYMLKKYPALKILGHSTCFWSEIGNDVTKENRKGLITGKVQEGTVVRLMRECPNLYCDLSADSGCNAMRRDPEFSYRFMEEFSDRLMYGTDICKPRQKTHLAAWLDNALTTGCITPENYKKICRSNAIKLFNLNIT